MFQNLIESQSHRREFKRRSSFFLLTVAGYAVILFGAGIGSIYAYDAQLEAQNSSLELINWVPPVTPDPPKPPTDRPPTVRRATPPDAPVDPTARVQERTLAQTSTNDPNKIPDFIGTRGIPIPPISDGPWKIGTRNVNPPAGAATAGCLTCESGEGAVKMEGKPPEPPEVKPPTTLRLPSTIFRGKATSLPQPLYPMIAKGARVQGSVSIQILVSEEGKVMSAQVVSGNAMLTSAARDAALRARFSPTILNGQPVKIQGVITYNFLLQ
ncbi:MAG TPA: energy transducer TonB [Pyrinomonadaceae bacterium]|nr:energy transducer TonB [Pyrinomonadaceae bacterium]